MESRHSLYVIDNTCADAKQNLKMDGPVNPSAVEGGLTNHFHSEQMGTAICWSHPEEKPSSSLTTAIVGNGARGGEDLILSSFCNSSLENIVVNFH